MAGNFGIGLGSFLSGVAQGAKTVSDIQAANTRNKLLKAQTDNYEEELAEKRRNKDIQADVDRIGQVGIQEGQAQYGDDVKKVLNHYYTNTIPQQQKRLIESGKLEAADMLGKFMETKQAKQLTETSAQAIKLASIGDYANLGPTIENLLNVSASVTGTGAYKLKGMTEATDDKGVKTGGVSFTVTDSNGKDQTIAFKDSGELIGFIRNNAMPDKIVEYAYDQDQQAKKVRAENAKEQREWNRKVTEKGLDHGYKIGEQNNASSLRIQEDRQSSGLRMQEENNKAQINSAYGLGSSGGNSKVAQAEAAAEYLRKNGYTDEQIRVYVPSLLGVQNNAKPMATRIEDTIKTLANSDPGFSRLAPAEQVSQARKLIAEIDGASQASSEVENPFSSNSGAKPASRGLPVYDTKTGTIIYR